MRCCWAIVGWAVLLCGSFFAVSAEEAPLVVQPTTAGYSAAEQAALDEAIVRLERLLIDTAFGSQRRLGQNGWDFPDFAAYTAGSLERLGYRTVIVTGQIGTPPAPRSWILVGLELGPTTVCWIPIVPLSNPARSQTTLGKIAEQASSGTGLHLDPSYMAYDSIVELLPNVPPVAVIRPPGTVYADQPTTLFSHTSTDPDGEIVLYQWSFVSGEQETTISSSIWHTFPTIGQHTILLTVTDNRGAQASTTLAITVGREPESVPCNCHKTP